MSLHFDAPGLTVAIALAVGLTVQALARHLRIPGIVLLLAAGALLGPGGLGLVRPEALGEGLEILVSYAVAVILFEGGLNLNLGRLRRQATVIRRLVTEGALVTAVGGALLSRYVMGWPWPVSIVFGTLVTVTGPTVVTPLLRRTRVKRRLHTILEAEGVFIDAVGALIAAVAFNAAFPRLVSGSVAPAGVLADFALRFGGGVLLGLVGGGVMVVLVRFERAVPRGLENVFILTLVLVLFQVSNGLLPESGIAASAVAGVLVGNARTRSTRELREFKEQLTVMMIGMLFVLLAADVGFGDVRALGAAGLLTVGGLMFIVRPVNVAVCTRGSGLGAADKAFLSWLAPRGIVAAAVSSLFAQEMTRHDIEGGDGLRALVFLVIAVTVLVQGLLAGPVARLLGVLRPRGGWAILGANPVSLELGRILQGGGQDVVFIDSNTAAVRAAEEAGLKVLWGSGGDDSVLRRAELDGRLGVVGATPNQEANLLFALGARDAFQVPDLLVAVQKDQIAMKPDDVRLQGARLAFGVPIDLERWTARLKRQRASRQRWELATALSGEGDLSLRIPDELSGALLPLALESRELVEPFHGETRIKPGGRVWFLLDDDRAAQARAWLSETGWTAAPPGGAADPSRGDRDASEAD